MISPSMELKLKIYVGKPLGLVSFGTRRRTVKAVRLALFGNGN
jgi:hypothetical protein